MVNDSDRIFPAALVPKSRLKSSGGRVDEARIEKVQSIVISDECKVGPSAHVVIYLRDGGVAESRTKAREDPLARLEAVVEKNRTCRIQPTHVIQSNIVERNEPS